MFIESKLKKELLNKKTSMKFNDNTNILKLFKDNGIFVSACGSYQEYKLRDSENDIIFKIENYPYKHIYSKIFKYRNGKYEERFFYNATDLTLDRYYRHIEPKYFGLDIHRSRPVFIVFGKDKSHVEFRKHNSRKDERIVVTSDILFDLGVNIEDLTNIKLSPEEMEIIKMSVI